MLEELADGTPLWRCELCRHVWRARRPAEPPQACPSCRSRRWADGRTWDTAAAASAAARAGWDRRSEEERSERGRRARAGRPITRTERTKSRRAVRNA